MISDIYRVSFFGETRIAGYMQNRFLGDILEKTVSELMKRYGRVDFFVGREGDFDLIAAAAVKRAQHSLGKEACRLNLVLSYRKKDEELLQKFYDCIIYPNPPRTYFRSAIEKRNRWMAENSELVLCFVEGEEGAAYTALKYAEAEGIKIYNLKEKMP